MSTRTTQKNNEFIISHPYFLSEHRTTKFARKHLQTNAILLIHPPLFHSQYRQQQDHEMTDAVERLGKIILLNITRRTSIRIFIHLFYLDANIKIYLHSIVIIILLLTVGGTPLEAMHKYAPACCLLTRLIFSTGPTYDVTGRKMFYQLRNVSNFTTYILLYIDAF